MDSPQKMDIVDWQDSAPPMVGKNDTTRRFLSPTFIGILGTLLLHALVIHSVPFGSRGPEAKSPEMRLSADALVNSKNEVTESLVLITLQPTANSDQAITQNVISALPDLSKLKIKSPVIVDPRAFLETLALSEDHESKSMAASSDGTEQVRLFGIYTGQIQARIDRVWRRPRTPINEDTSATKADAGDSFQCEAQIVQDARGNVQEILLPRCNGTYAWQRSLVLAIQQASPLPAPPSTKVFTQSITLNFVGLPYTQGASNEEYELQGREVADSHDH